MLSKDICFMCCEKHWPEHSSSGWGWASDGDKHWDNGYVCCPVFEPEAVMDAKVKSPPPKYCLYRFEQSVAAGKTHGK